MALTNEGVQLWLTENLGEQAAKVYELQRNIDRSDRWSQEYFDAYAYGDADAAQAVFNKASKSGASWIEMDHEVYKTIWQQACRCIESYWDIPEDFRDHEKYES